MPIAVEQRLDDQRLQTTNFPSMPLSAPTLTQPNQTHSTTELTAAEFQKRPDLIQRAMLPALIQANADMVAFLLPFYQQLPATLQDPMWLKWAEAIIQKSQKNDRTSIAYYRELIAEHNDIVPIRLQLAIALFDNKEWNAAADQFYKLRSEKLPSALLQRINGYLTAIQRAQTWEFNVGVSYLYDPNINNAPQAGTRLGNWRAPEKESARGWGMTMDIAKKWSWGNQFFHKVRLNGNGKYYWNNKKYNEYTARLSLGVGWENAQHTLTLSPFVEQAWYAGGNPKSQSVKRFSHDTGLNLEWQYWFSAQWQLNTLYEYSKQHYRSRKHLNGHQHVIGGTLVYLQNAKRYWFMGSHFQLAHTRDLDDSYVRKSISVGFAQEWPNGISTRLAVNYVHKNYKAPMPIFQITQKNREYGATFSLWHRAIHFGGITPRLTWQYNKVKSNHVFYHYDKQRLFLELSKTF